MIAPADAAYNFAIPSERVAVPLMWSILVPKLNLGYQSSTNCLSSVLQQVCVKPCVNFPSWSTHSIKGELVNIH